MEKLTFKDLQDSKKMINKKVDRFSSILNSFPAQDNGLVSDVYTKTNEFQDAKKHFAFWFKQLQEINKYINKHHKKENRDLQISKRFKKAK